MGLLELFILAIGLSMDAFAVAICKGLATERVTLKHSCITGAWFGGFQALMPLIGYFLGTSFEKYVTKVDHWIAFILLGAIGTNMIKEAFSKEENDTDCSFAFKTMLVMAVATSIDALAVGITFALLPEINIFAAITLIGVITFIMSAIGVTLGNVFGGKYKSKAEFLGGAILIILGLKILLEHLDVL
ncbi:MAG: manganese efflux pump [Clostridia bacterium]|nr:manganese efflux pump [Clostridia bacterium]